MSWNVQHDLLAPVPQPYKNYLAKAIIVVLLPLLAFALVLEALNGAVQFTWEALQEYHEMFTSPKRW